MIQVSTALNSYRLQGTLDYLQLGGSVPVLQVYASLRPSFGLTPVDPMLLVAIPLKKPTGEVVGGVLNLFQSEDAMVLMNGVPVWGRLLSASGAIAADGSVSEVGGGGDFIVPNMVMYGGGFVRLVKGTFR